MALPFPQGNLAMDYFNNSSTFYWPGFFENVSNATVLYDQLIAEVVAKVSVDYPKWVMSIGGCLLVGLSGIFPLLLFSQEGGNPLSEKGRGKMDTNNSGEFEGGIFFGEGF